MAGNTSVTIPVGIGSFIAVYRKAANKVGLYLIDSFYAISTVADNSDVSLSISSGVLTIQNKI